MEAMPGAAADPGVIAYVQRSTHDIHAIAPDRYIAVQDEYRVYLPLVLGGH